jgi:hypothetical protein
MVDINPKENNSPKNQIQDPSVVGGSADESIVYEDDSMDNKIQLPEEKVVKGKDGGPSEKEDSPLNASVITETQKSHSAEVDEKFDFSVLKDLWKRIKSFKMPKGIELFDYLIMVQLVCFIIWSLKFHHKYEMVIVYFSAIGFIGWWLIRIVFSKQHFNNQNS